MFTIDRNTKPADVMIEGRPEIEIVAFGPGKDHTKEYPQPEGVYVYAKAFDGDGDAWDGGTLAAEGWGYPKNGMNMRTHSNVFATFDGQSKWGRLVPRNVFRLTKDTDPATVMFQGYPDTRITAIRPRIAGACSTPGQVYVEFKTEGGLDRSIAHNPDGTYAAGSGGRGRVVPRPAKTNAFDPTKPFHAVTDSTGEVARYELESTVIPADGSETRYVVRRSKGEVNAGATLAVYASTGRVIEGIRGSALRFVNGPVIETHQGSFISQFGNLTVDLKVVTSDGKPISIAMV